MHPIEQEEFLRQNDIIANKRVVKLLFCAMIAEICLAIGRFVGLFEADYRFCIIISLISMGLCIVDTLLCRDDKYFKFTKYFGLVASEILIGLQATQLAIGINICFVFVPILSCMYLDSRLTRNISVFCYFIMIIALYVRSFQEAEKYIIYTQWYCFISQTAGFTIEYVLSTIVLSSLTKYLKALAKKYYEENTEKIYTCLTDQVKSAFAKNLSNELKDVLTKVDAATEELLSDRQIEGNSRENVQAISQISKMIYSKLADLSDFTKIDLSKKNTVNKKYHLSSLIEEIKHTMATRIGSKNIDFNIVVNPMIPDELEGDKVRIRQMLINLLSDGINEMEDGFIVLKIDWKKKEDVAQLYIDVMDNSYNTRIEKAKSDNSTFSICRNLCERMNGTIKISSDYEKGSGFSITLPQKIANPQNV